MWQKALFFLLVIFILSPWGSSVYALALGLAMALAFGNPFPKLSGKPSKYLLQISVAMLGFGIDLNSVYRAGKDGIGFILFVVVTSLVVGYFLGRALNVMPRVRTLISAGTAICGGSAIAAVGPAIKAENDEMTVSLGTVFVLNAIALFAFPMIGAAFGLSQQQFGLWAAVAIQDTSSVVGASSAYGGESLVVATTVKLARTLFIIPLALALAFMYRGEGGESKVTLPWFIFAFLAAAAVKTLSGSIILPSMLDSLVNLAKAGLAVTLFLIGLSLTRETLKSVGWRPFALGALLWILISVISLIAITRLT